MGKAEDQLKKMRKQEDMSASQQPHQPQQQERWQTKSEELKRHKAESRKRKKGSGTSKKSAQHRETQQQTGKFEEDETRLLSSFASKLDSLDAEHKELSQVNANHQQKGPSVFDQLAAAASSNNKAAFEQDEAALLKTPSASS